MPAQHLSIRSKKRGKHNALPSAQTEQFREASTLLRFPSPTNDTDSSPVFPYSLDQYTSFAKEPWGFDRPENRKEHSLLSRATFAEWPNTTCDFSIQRGLAPPGKLSISKAKVVDRSGKAQVSTERNGSERGMFAGIRSRSACL